MDEMDDFMRQRRMTDFKYDMQVHEGPLTVEQILTSDAPVIQYKQE